MSDTVAKACFDAMTKCTTEQLWVTGTFGGFSLAAISQSEKIAQTLGNVYFAGIALLFWIAVSLFSVLLIINRHRGYYGFWRDFIEVVRRNAEEPGMKALVEESKNTEDPKALCLLVFSHPSQHVRSLFGVGYYSGLIILLSFLAATSVWRHFLQN